MPSPCVLLGRRTGPGRFFFDKIQRSVHSKLRRKDFENEILQQAAKREQPCVFEMPCTGRRQGRFFSDLDWGASRCRRKFCALTAEVRKRKLHHGSCHPSRQSMAQSGFLSK